MAQRVGGDGGNHQIWQLRAAWKYPGRRGSQHYHNLFGKLQFSSAIILLVRTEEEKKNILAP